MKSVSVKTLINSPVRFSFIFIFVVFREFSLCNEIEFQKQISEQLANFPEFYQEFSSFNSNNLTEENQYYFSENLGEDPFNVTESITDIMRDLLIISLNKTENNLTSVCKEKLIDIIENNKTDYITKIYSDSSKVLNNVGSYEDCRLYEPNEHVSINKEFNYGVVRIQNRDSPGSIEYDCGAVIIGICFLKVCNEDDIGNFTTSLKSIIGELVRYKQKDVSVFILEKFQEQYTIPQIVLLHFIPVYVLLTLFIFTCFPKVPGFLFRCCFKNIVRKPMSKDFFVGNFVEKNDLDESLKSDQDDNSCNSFFIDDGGSEVLSNVDKLLMKMKSKEGGEEKLDHESLNKFMKCFNFTENSDEIFSSSNSRLNNDSGLKFLRGMRSFFMLNYSIGLVFYVLLDSPLKIHNPDEVTELIYSKYFAYLVFCFRTCPKILLSISGFSLAYKLVCYLEKRKSSNSYEENRGNSVNVAELDEIAFKKKNRIENKFLFAFIVRFLHKFFLYLLYDLIFKFSFMFLVSLRNQGPMLVYCKKYMIGEIDSVGSLLSFLSRLFLIEYFYQFSLDSMDVFWYVRNEILLFLILTIIIFVCYKKNLSMDLILIRTFLLITFAKIAFFLYSEFYTDEIIVSTALLYFSKYAILFTHPLFNLQFFCIGAFFGLSNFVVQKSLSSDDVKDEYFFLKASFNFIKFIKENSKKSIFLIIWCLWVNLLSFVMIMVIFYFYNCGHTTECLQTVRMNFWLRLSFIFSTELVITNMLILFTKFVVLGSNFISNFLRHDLWTFLSKIFFSHSMICMVMIIYVYYQSESRINIDLVNILFFSIFTSCIVVLFSAFSFIVLEVPLKKLNLFFLLDNENSMSNSNKASSYDVNKFKN